MKKLLTTTVGVLLFAASGCSSTLTVGPQANKDTVVGADVGDDGVSVTLPLVKGTVGAAGGDTEK